MPHTNGGIRDVDHAEKRDGSSSAIAANGNEMLAGTDFAGDNTNCSPSLLPQPGSSLLMAKQNHTVVGCGDRLVGGLRLSPQCEHNLSTLLASLSVVSSSWSFRHFQLTRNLVWVFYQLYDEQR